MAQDEGNILHQRKWGDCSNRLEGPTSGALWTPPSMERAPRHSSGGSFGDRERPLHLTKWRPQSRTMGGHGGFRASQTHRPKVIIESWRSDPTLWQYGPTSKPTTTRWREAGYNINCRTIKATAIGGAVTQERLLVVRTRIDCRAQWTWDSLDRDLSVIRPMGNLLTPPGLVPRNSYSQSGSAHTPHSLHDPMPNQIGAWIKTEKGVRRLMKEEVAQGLGIPKGCETELDQRPGTTITLDNDVFNWHPPDLSLGSPWHTLRLANLPWAADHYPEPDNIYWDGIQRLAVHRNNYNSEGPDPKRLQLLWWEFPSEHWGELRNGARQNFLKQPDPCLRPNAPMDEEMLEAAVQFVDELVELGVLPSIDEGLTVLTNAPLFVVGKDGQPGQWRVIADMLRGGQNDCVGQDPVFMPRIAHIVDQMYTEGYSAVVDLSKFFYNFPTHPDD
ncbi:unnamed protein product [Cylindrotheca closterium]|uniref:Reverse transcriptase domain-containing protein n=1 Tax=Cylindrotheca closterium TaxID=2856 RepID=A0AAD2JL61_9STRA|nr:unnamed protein product [Cylindrotheca closterium]